MSNNVTQGASMLAEIKVIWGIVSTNHSCSKGNYCSPWIPQCLRPWLLDTPMQVSETTATQPIQLDSSYNVHIITWIRSQCQITTLNWTSKEKTDRNMQVDKGCSWTHNNTYYQYVIWIYYKCIYACYINTHFIEFSFVEFKTLYFWFVFQLQRC